MGIGCTLGALPQPGGPVLAESTGTGDVGLNGSEVVQIIESDLPAQPFHLLEMFQSASGIQSRPV